MEGLVVTQKSVSSFFESGINIPRIRRFRRLRSTAFLKTLLPTTTVTGSFLRLAGLVLIIRFTLNRELFSVFLTSPAQDTPSAGGPAAFQKTVGAAAFSLFWLIGSFGHEKIISRSILNVHQVKFLSTGNAQLRHKTQVGAILAIWKNIPMINQRNKSGG